MTLCNKLTFFLFWLAATPCYADLSIDTIPYWNGTTWIQPFGLPNTATYGQTITAPVSSAPALSSFSFEMNLPATVSFKGYVFAWDGTKAIGSALYTSAVTSTAGTGFQKVTFNTGSVALTPGASYVLLASASEVPTSSGVGTWGNVNNDVYFGGQLVFLNNGTDSSQWTTVSWTIVSRFDMVFSANFVDVPEPTAAGLGLIGFVVLGSARRKLGV